MSFKISNSTAVRGKQVPLEDGEYSAVIKSIHIFDTDMDANDVIAIDNVNAQHEGAIVVNTTTDTTSYVELQLSDRVLRYYLNNAVAVDLFTGGVNEQLNIENPVEGFYNWFGNVVGAEVQVWQMSVTAIDKKTGESKPYQNTYFRKPVGFGFM